MKRKALVVVSTVAVFVLTVIAACVWLFRVRYIDVTADKEIIAVVDGKLNDAFADEPILSVGYSDVCALFASDPYVKVEEVETVFPDRLKVTVKKRVEKYLVVSGDEKYVVDEEFVLLRKGLDISGEGLTVVKVTSDDIAVESLVLGKKIEGTDEGLFDCAVKIYDSLRDKSVVSRIEITDEPTCVNFYLKTGVYVQFGFTSGVGGTLTKEEKDAVCAKTAEAEEFFNSSTEYERLCGVILVFANRDVTWSMA